MGEAVHQGERLRAVQGGGMLFGGVCATVKAVRPTRVLGVARLAGIWVGVARG